jgi:hypothetical protein
MVPLKLNRPLQRSNHYTFFPYIRQPNDGAAIGELSTTGRKIDCPKDGESAIGGALVESVRRGLLSLDQGRV